MRKGFWVFVLRMSLSDNQNGGQNKVGCRSRHFIIMLHELLLALSGDIGGIFVQKHKEGLKVGFGEIIIQIFEN